MAYYRATLTAIAPDATVEPETNRVQQALAALQDKALA